MFPNIFTLALSIPTCNLTACMTQKRLTSNNQNCTNFPNMDIIMCSYWDLVKFDSYWPEQLDAGYPLYL